jgi:hypothetical protein
MYARLDLRATPKPDSVVDVEDEPRHLQKGRVMLKGTFTLISNSPKTWGVRVNGKGKKGARVETINRWGASKTLTLVGKVGDVPADPYGGRPEGEIWTFQN